MACLEPDFPQDLSTHQSYDAHFNLQLDDNLANKSVAVPCASTSSPTQSENLPKPPPLPGFSPGVTSFNRKLRGCCVVPEETRLAWDRLFEEGYEADVHVLTDNSAVILAHSCVLGVQSAVLRNLLKQAKVRGGFRQIKIPSVPIEAARAFIRYLYSSCFEIDEMKRYVLHLLILSHRFSIPSLKRACIEQIERELLTTENVVDMLQLARQCDAPQLSLLCMQLIIKEFKIVSVSEGWKVMKQASPSLEQELLESLVEADSRRQERMKKIEEKKVYLQLSEAMDALLHICRDGCGTIGPCDKVLKDSQAKCNFPACKGLESLLRHFSGCKARVPGGCSHCKRMWQLLELHSCMCSEPDSCNVPLCRDFKDKMQHQCRKDEMKWKLLVWKVMAAKGTIKSITARRFLVP